MLDTSLGPLAPPSAWHLLAEPPEYTAVCDCLAAHGVSTVSDLLAHEYGWTHEYILEGLTRAQVEVYLAAISRRYKRESDAMHAATEGHGSDNGRHRNDDGTINLDEVLKRRNPADVFRELDIPVELN